MLNARGYSVGLNTSYISRSHLTCKQRIFGEILEVSAATRVALDVHAGSEKNVDMLVDCFLTEHLAHFLTQLVVPAVSHRSGGRETSCGNGCVKSEVIGSGSLFTYAVRSVRKEHGRDLDVVSVDANGLPEVLTGRKSDLFFQCKFGD